MVFWSRSDWINPFRLSSYNWIDFTFVRASAEIDCRFGNFEFYVALLGFHFGGSFDLWPGDTELRASLAQTLKEIDSGEARVSITLAELNELRRKAGETE